jgi:hypothetical protein
MVVIILFLLSVSSIIFLILFLTKKCKSDDNNCPPSSCPPPPKPYPSKIEKEFKADIINFNNIPQNIIDALYKYNKCQINNVYINPTAKAYFERLLKCGPSTISIFILQYVIKFIASGQSGKNHLKEIIIIYYCVLYYHNYDKKTNIYALNDYCNKIACGSSKNILQPAITKQELITNNFFQKNGKPGIKESGLKLTIELYNYLKNRKDYNIDTVNEQGLILSMTTLLKNLIDNDPDYNTCIKESDTVAKKLVINLIDSLIITGFECILNPDSCSS